MRPVLMALALLIGWLGHWFPAVAQAPSVVLPPEPALSPLEDRLYRLSERAAICAAVSGSRWVSSSADPGWVTDSAGRRFWSDGYLADAVRVACETGHLKLTGFGISGTGCDGHQYGNLRFLNRLIPRLDLRSVLLSCLTWHEISINPTDGVDRTLPAETTAYLYLQDLKLPSLELIDSRNLVITVSSSEIRNLRLRGAEGVSLNASQSQIESLSLWASKDTSLLIRNSQIGHIPLASVTGGYVTIHSSRLKSFAGWFLVDLENLTLSQVDIAEDVRITNLRVGGRLFLDRVTTGGDLDLSGATLGMPAAGQVPSARLNTDPRSNTALSCGWARHVEAQAERASIFASRQEMLDSDGNVIGYEGGEPDNQYESDPALIMSNVRAQGALRLGRVEVRGQTRITGSEFGSVDASDSCWLGRTEFSNSRIRGNASLNRMAITPMWGNFAQDGLINWYGLRIDGYLEMPDFHAGARTNLYRLSVGSHLYAGNSIWNGGLLARDLDVGRDVDFIGAIARVGGSIEHATAQNSFLDCKLNMMALCDLSARNLWLDRTRIAGFLTVRNARLRGHVTLNDAELDGPADFGNGSIDGHFGFERTKRLRDLNLSHSQIKMMVYGEHIEEWLGELRLHATSVGQGVLLGDIKMWRGRIWGEDIRVPSLFRVRNARFERFESCGSDGLPCRNIDMAYGQIEGSLDLSGNWVPEAIRLVGMKIGGDVNLAGTAVGGRFDLSQSSLATLRSQRDPCRAEAQNPQAPAQVDPGRGTADGHLGLFGKGELVLGGTKMLYPALSQTAIRPYDPEGKRRIDGQFAPIRLGGAEYSLRADLGCPDDLLKQKAESIISWVSNPKVTPDGRDPQPYEQLAKALSETGRRMEADEVLKAKFERREQANETGFWERVRLALLGWAVGYGLETERAILWWGALVAFGTLVRLGFPKVVWNVFARVALRLKRPRYRLNLFHRPDGRLRLLNHAFWFSFCQAIPVVPDLYPPKRPFMERVDDMPPSIGPSEAYGYFILHKIMAAILLAVVAASAAGLIK